MQSLIEKASLARVAGLLAILGHLVAAFAYILLPMLVVPFPALYAFWATWVIILGASIWWLRRHPWRSFVLPLVGLVLVVAAVSLGERFLGWTG